MDVAKGNRSRSHSALAHTERMGREWETMYTVREKPAGLRVVCSVLVLPCCVVCSVLVPPCCVVCSVLVLPCCVVPASDL